MSALGPEAQSSQRQDDEIDLQKLLGAVLDNKLLIIAITALAFLLGVFHAFTATPIYKADALLQIEKQAGMPGFAEMSKVLDQDNSTAGEIEILRSRMVLGDAVDSLGMSVRLSRKVTPLIGRFTRPGPAAEPGPIFASLVDARADIRVAEFIVPAALEGRAFVLQAGADQDAKAYRLLLDGKLVLAGVAGQRVSSEDGRITLKLDTFSMQPDDVVMISKQPRLALIRALRGGLSVSEQGRGSGILNISFTGPSQRGNRAILDAIAEAYLMQNVKRLSAEVEKSLDFLAQQLPEIRASLEEAEDRLNKFRLESGSIDMSFETSQVLTSLVALEAKQSELRYKEKELASLYTREHPLFRTLIQQQQNVSQEIEKLSEQMRDLPETQQEVLRLTRDVQVNQEIYVQMLNKSQELRVVRAGTVGNVRIIDEAVSAPAPIRPKKAMIVMLATIIGGVFSVAIVLLRAAFHRGIETAAQLEESGLPVYATIPLSDQQYKLSQLLEEMQPQVAPASKPKSALLALENPADPAIEALRSLRTSLHFAMMDAGNPVLMVSGPSPSVGKSFVSANLAVALAQIGRRVLLIDGDMRKGHLHKYFHVPVETGLSSYLSGQNTLDHVTHKTAIDNVEFIARGVVPPNPAELLMHDRFAALIKSVSASYDLIIIDSPPVLAVTDASIIGQYAGTNLLVARFGQNTVQEVQMARQRFAQNGVVIKGAILNCMERRAANAYGYYAYNYKQ
ncbi:MAG: polysaccharide biosynthesis tyrosine autokinase [Alcanivoracaceae bacterium]|jgi:tyrosine-protein kinase Etk/Wzc|nr:polysaccharide biosynthesis tyrosine autokinase [Alcanivoracaceae bacterium]